MKNRRISHSKSVAAVATIALLCCGASFTQEHIPSGLVILHVRVTNTVNHAVVDVPQSSFRIFEDGVEQKIVSFSKEEVPVSYGLAIDASGSLREQIEAVILAGLRIVNSNKPEDDAFLIRFISSDKIEVVQEPTSDRQLLTNGLQDLYVEAGQTAVLDAVYLSVDKLAKQPHSKATRRRALVLVTDGEERNSYYKLEHVLKLLGSTDVQIYAIGFTGQLKEKSRTRARDLLRLLATETGGRAFFPTSGSELKHISDEIINDIRTQYVIGYFSSNSDTQKSFHKVEVSLMDNPNYDKRVAVTRVGYSKRSR